MPYVKRVHACKVPTGISIWLNRVESMSVWRCPLCSSDWVLGYKNEWHRKVEIEDEPVQPRRRYGRF